ncbi:GNAT family N-acetyltransferase [Dactylosporangium sp. NPDC049742]|uniref:GNAT family N-acetyltransferase n=1 Tax=Dactylosporangium sp. NPDC049742 TaxID=3154737 RepID=UPI00341B026E
MLTTRVGGPLDAPVVARLWAAADAARRAAAGAGHQTEATAEARTLRMLAGTGSLLVVAEAEGEPAAMTVVVQALARDGAGDPIPGLAHVTMVAVDPSRWGLGLGAAVVTRAQAEARGLGYTQAQLWTQQSNARADRLYRRLGWTLSGRTTTDEHGEPIRHYIRAL